MDEHQVRELVDSGRLPADDCPFALRDAGSKQAVRLQNASCFWYDYKQAYVMIASEAGGPSPLGEVWYAHSKKPEGPWRDARKIITHANKKNDMHDFYNPTHHPFLDRSGGRIIYLEGSYTNAFSGNVHDTPITSTTRFFTAWTSRGRS